MFIMDNLRGVVVVEIDSGLLDPSSITDRVIQLTLRIVVASIGESALTDALVSGSCRLFTQTNALI